jgi:hypothetical protein
VRSPYTPSGIHTGPEKEQKNYYMQIWRVESVVVSGSILTTHTLVHVYLCTKKDDCTVRTDRWIFSQ